MIIDAMINLITVNRIPVRQNKLPFKQGRALSETNRPSCKVNAAGRDFCQRGVVRDHDDSQALAVQTA